MTDSTIHPERLVIHTAMHRPSALMDLPMLPLHFQSEAHAALWETILALSGDGLPVDPVSVSDAAELVREKLFRLLGDELPYSVAVEIEKFEVTENLRRIYVGILVDKSTQTMGLTAVSNAPSKLNQTASM